MMSQGENFAIRTLYLKVLMPIIGVLIYRGPFEFSSIKLRAIIIFDLGGLI